MSARGRLMSTFLVARVAANCFAAEPKPEVAPLGIGLLLPPAEAEAGSIRRGAELGIEAVNGLPGAKVRLVIRGRSGQWGTEGDDAVVLAMDEGMRALIAPPSGSASHQVLQVAGRTRVPVVSLCSDSSVTAPGIPWTVRIAPRTDEEAAALFAALGRAGEPLRVAAFVPPDRAGREAAKDLRAAADAAKVSLVDPVRVLPNTNLPTLVEAVLPHAPDLILVWLEPAEAGRVVKALRESGFAGRLAGPGRLRSSAFFQAAGAAAEGVMFPVLTALSKPSAIPRGNGVTGSAADVPTDYTAQLAFDAVSVLADVLRRAGDQPAFREFPLKRTIVGATGPIAFDESGNRRVKPGVVEVRGDELHVLSAPGIVVPLAAPSSP